MTIWMITGLHDARWTANVAENFLRQKYLFRRLIVVENGDCIGSAQFSELLTRDYVKLQSEGGPAQPLNAALAWLRENASPDDWFCKCDSDDYYGPGYLDSVAQAATSGADYAGRASLYIRTTDGRLWYIEGEPNGHLFHGPTLAARIGSALDFPVVAQWGEDEGWCRAMRDAGKRPNTIGPESFCYQRWSDYGHTWPCTDYELRTSWNAAFVDLGAIDYSIVDGIKPRPIGQALHSPEVTVDNLMPIRILREKLAQEVHNMKTIPIPTHTIKDETGTDVDIRWFITWLTNTDAEFNRDGQAIRASVRVDKAVAEATPETITVEEQDYTRIKTSAETPSVGGYPVRPGRAAAPWIEAIASAT